MQGVRKPSYSLAEKRVWLGLFSLATSELHLEIHQWGAGSEGLCVTGELEIDTAIQTDRGFVAFGDGKLDRLASLLLQILHNSE
jgi:hypothetical protein